MALYGRRFYGCRHTFIGISWPAHPIAVAHPYAAHPIAVAHPYAAHPIAVAHLYAAHPIAVADASHSCGRRIPMRRLFPAFSSVHGEEAGDLLFTEIRLMKGALDQREYDRCF